MMQFREALPDVLAAVQVEDLAFDGRCVIIARSIFSYIDRLRRVDFRDVPRPPVQCAREQFHPRGIFRRWKPRWKRQLFRAAASPRTDEDAGVDIETEVVGGKCDEIEVAALHFRAVVSRFPEISRRVAATKNRIDRTNIQLRESS